MPLAPEPLAGAGAGQDLSAGLLLAGSLLVRDTHNGGPVRAVRMAAVAADRRHIAAMEIA